MDGCQGKFHWLKLYYCKRKRFSMRVSEVILGNIGVLLRLVLHYNFSENLILHDHVRFPVPDAKCFFEYEILKAPVIFRCSDSP